MKPKLHLCYAYAFVSLLTLSALRSALGDEVLYEDNFTNLDLSWGAGSQDISVQNGKLNLRPTVKTTYSLLNQANVFDDAEISVEVTMSAGDTNVPGGLIFWAKDYSNFYCLCIDAEGQFKVSRFVTDRWLNPVGWTKEEAINKGVGQVNRLRMVTKGRQASAYINDKQVAMFDGQPPQGGGCIGLSGASAENSQNTWQFARLKVSAISSAVASSPIAQPPAAPPPIARLPAAPQSDVSAPPTPAPTPQLDSPVALRLHGSNTIGMELVPALCEEFLKFEGATSVQRKPGAKEDETDIEAVLPNESTKPLKFEVQAHGSKTAFEDLAAGACDIGMASRPIKPDEAQQCARAGLGDMFSAACEKVLGSDGIAVFVNKSNPINALTKEQIANIFSGKITDWSQIGGNPGPVDPYAPDDKSGTFDTFKSLVLGTESLLPEPYATRIVRNFRTTWRPTRTELDSPAWHSCAAVKRLPYQSVMLDLFCQRLLLSRLSNIRSLAICFSTSRPIQKTNGLASSLSLLFQSSEGVPT